MKVFGGQTNPDILTKRDMPHFTGDDGHLSILKKSFSVYTFFDEN